MPREFRLQQIIFADGKASLRGRDRLADFEGPVRDAGGDAVDLAGLLPAAQRTALAAVHKKFTDRIARQLPPGVVFGLSAVVWHIDGKQIAFEGTLTDSADNTPLGVQAFFLPLRVFTLEDVRGALAPTEVGAMGLGDGVLQAIADDANVLDAADLEECDRIVARARQRAAAEEPGVG